MNDNMGWGVAGEFGNQAAAESNCTLERDGRWERVAGRTGFGYAKFTRGNRSDSGSHTRSHIVRPSLVRTIRLGKYRRGWEWG